MAPGGRQPYCMEIIKTQKPASQKKSPKLAAVVGGFSYPNFFHAIGLAPSGGPILSSIAKKESGKKDAT